MVNKPVFQQHIDQAFMDALAFYVGWNLLAVDKSVSKKSPNIDYDRITEVFEKYSGIPGGLDSSSRRKIISDLLEVGVDITPAGVDYLYKAYHDNLI
jgi:hypothetical protein